MSWYEDRVLPRLINLACGVKPASRQREKIVPLASGDVLEVGFGSGLNLPYYDRSQVRRIFALEPSAGMLRLAQKNIEASDLDVETIGLPGEEIPLDDDSVDTVLVTYTLCSIDDVKPALAGMRHVLKPGGRLLYCEHGKAPDASVHKWQDRLNAGWKRLSGGCNMNRDIPAMIALSYNYWGTARIR